jgi:hypothetical protein
MTTKSMARLTTTPLGPSIASHKHPHKHRFLIYMLGKNIEPTCFTEVIEDYAASLPSRQKNGMVANLNDGA